ncbi:SGNH/GDSL hydrolase family protein [Acholeplasma granularum]|uniref:SGNH/GDSL hydrolase family protein n=1 Tax=Acholeplasma granularum TaxID=264635 RepID=UPI00046E9378|nr:SGNH/GDSL hydrolase family protein [Acholeplasma granularum]
MLFRKNDTVIFFGDSITAKGKTKIEDAPKNETIGNGFVSFINAYLLIHHPKLNIRIINQGISGNKTPDLIQRIDDDLLAFNPNWVITMIGANDAWRQVDFPQNPKFWITDEMFSNNIEELIVTLKSNNINQILISPFMIEKNDLDPLKIIINRYAKIMEELSIKHNIPFIHMQKAFDKLLVDANSYTLSKDRMHPNVAGHLFISEEIIKVLENK